MSGQKIDRATAAVLHMARVEASKRNPTTNLFDVLGGEESEAAINEQNYKIKAYDNEIREARRTKNPVEKAEEKRRPGHLNQAKGKLPQAPPSKAQTGWDSVASQDGW